MAALLASSCGLHVSKELRAQGIRGAVGQGTAQQAGTPLSTTGGNAAAGTTGQAPVIASGGTTTGTTGTTGGPGGGTTEGSGAQTGIGAVAPAPTGGNGGATDVGVTATQINLGAVVTLSGPVPGLFAGDAYGARAYFAYINSLGGIYGRQLNLTVADDQLDCGINRTQHLSLLPKVLGFTSSLSLYDNCGAAVLADHKDVPDVSLSFSTQAGSLPNGFSLNPLVPGYRLGSLQYYKSKFPDAVKHLGTLVGNIGSAVEIWNGIEAAAVSIGYHKDYQRNYSPGETDFTADVIQMRQAGVRMLYFVSADSHTISRVLNTAAQQNWHPDLIAVGAGDAAYDPSFIPEAGAAAEGVYADQPHAAFFNPTDAVIPGVKLYQEWMGKIGQSNHEDLYSAWGWGSARLAVQALKAAGPKLTRASWLTAQKNVHTFDGDGMFAPSDPAGKKPSTCYVVLQVTRAQWVRKDTPASSFRCDAPYFYYKK
jgi:branched-chain amino acid transport system substrate-binding protein